MGTIASILPKNIVIDQSNTNWELPSGPRNIGFMNAMAPPGGSDAEGSFTNTRVRCSGATIICEKRRFENGQPTGDWTWADATQGDSFTNEPTCQNALDALGNPCKVTGRSLPGVKPKMFDFKNWGTKEYLIAGTAAILLVGVVAVIASKKKA